MKLFRGVDQVEVCVNIEASILLHDVGAHCVNGVVPVIDHELDGGTYLYNLRKIIEVLHYAMSLSYLLNGLVELDRWFVIGPKHVLPYNIFLILHDFYHFPNVLVVQLARLFWVSEPNCVRDEWNNNIVFLLLGCKSCIIVV